MGVIKNEVGRPSNKIKKIRMVLKLIGVLVVITLAVFLGYYIKDNEKKIVNNKIDNNESNNNSTKELDITKAEEIMYGVFNNKTFFDYFDIDTFNSDTFKTVYAIINTTPIKGSYTCKELFGNNLESYGGIDGTGYWFVRIDSKDFTSNTGLLCVDNEEKDYYAYDDVEKTFIKMFSKGKIVKDFVSVELVSGDDYAYSESKNLYTWLSCECGDSVANHVYGVVGARQNKNNIYIDFKIASFEPSNNENVYIGIDDSKKEVTMDVKDVLNNNIDKLTGEYNTYTFIFEKVDSGYKFVEVK